jgi:sulfur carrier protein
MKVVLRNPRREVEIDGVSSVSALLARLDVVAESVLVICNDELVTRDARLSATDVVEIRPVVSGGAR